MVIVVQVGLKVGQFIVYIILNSNLILLNNIFFNLIKDDIVPYSFNVTHTSN